MHLYSLKFKLHRRLNVRRGDFSRWIAIMPVPHLFLASVPTKCGDFGSIDQLWCGSHCKLPHPQHFTKKNSRWVDWKFHHFQFFNFYTISWARRKRNFWFHIFNIMAFCILPLDFSHLFSHIRIVRLHGCCFIECKWMNLYRVDAIVQ